MADFCPRCRRRLRPLLDGDGTPVAILSMSEPARLTHGELIPQEMLIVAWPGRGASLEFIAVEEPEVANG